MIWKTARSGLFLCLILILLTSCTPQEPSVGPGEQMTPTSKPLETTVVPPTETPVPPTPSPLPTEPTSLNAAGPYLYYKSEDKIWISNPDGEFLTQIAANIDGRYPIQISLSPQRDAIAAIAKDGDDFNLVEIRIPSGETLVIDNLLTLTHEESIDAAGSKSIASYAVRKYPSIAWQPTEGRYLAYIGARVGPTADLYLYDRVTKETEQLTDGASQAIMPTWSPDGQYILHYGVSWEPPFGGAILGYNQVDGSWAVRLSDREVFTQPDIDSVNFVGWLESRKYITFDVDLEVTDGCASGVFKAVDVATRESALLSQDCFSGYHDFSPSTKTILVSNTSECACSPGQGLFLIPTSPFSPIKVFEERIWGVDWMPESGVFQAYPELLISADGTQKYYPPDDEDAFHPAISLSGYQAWEVIENRQGRVVLKSPGGSWQTIMEGSVAELIWDPLTGETLLIMLRDGSLFRASAPDFLPEEIGFFGAQIKEAGWILP